MPFFQGQAKISIGKASNISYDEIIVFLNPTRNLQLSISVIFERSPARIYDVLSMLKKEMIIENFRVKSSEYWIIKTKKAVIISHLKYKYLNILMEDCQHTNELAEKMGVSWKTAFNRLNELEKIGLVKRNENKIWEIAKSSKKVIVI